MRPEENSGQYILAKCSIFDYTVNNGWLIMKTSILPTPDVPNILVVDDEKVIREILAEFLTLEGFNVTTAEDGGAAVDLLANNHFNMVITDLKMPNIGGLDLLEIIKKKDQNILTVIMTGFGTVETAKEAMKKGAYDYIQKPFKVDEVLHIVQRAIEKQRLIDENIQLKQNVHLYRVSEEIATSLSANQIISTVMDTTVNAIKPDLVRLMLLDTGNDRFLEESRIQSEQWPEEELDGGELDMTLLVEIHGEGGEVLAHGPASDEFFRGTPPEDLYSFMTVPFIVRQRVIGLMAVYSFSPNKRFTEGQRKLLNLISARAASAIENARLYTNLQDTFRQTIQGLASALEAMDKYTSGHSDRVALYSRLIAVQMKLEKNEIELITQAALMHDIGKMGCHANLNKPGKLTGEEYEIFKAHPTFGKEILETITFLHALIPGVYLHHERWDGKGYPLGLSRTEIPLMARILAVADTYDAMTSDRAYRKALSHRVAVAELERCSGTQFDPDVVNAFLIAINRYREEQEQKSNQSESGDNASELPPRFTVINGG